MSEQILITDVLENLFSDTSMLLPFAIGVVMFTIAFSVLGPRSMRKNWIYLILMSVGATFGFLVITNGMGFVPFSDVATAVDNVSGEILVSGDIWVSGNYAYATTNPDDNLTVFTITQSYPTYSTVREELNIGSDDSKSVFDTGLLDTDGLIG